jgi:hypothetical protein
MGLRGRSPQSPVRAPRFTALSAVLVVLAGSAGAGAFLVSGGSGDQAGDSRVRTSSPSAKSLLGRLPLSFISNEGQVDPRVSYYVRGPNTSLYFTPRGLTLSLTKAKAASPASGLRTPTRRSRGPEGASRWAVEMRFPGAREARPVALHRMPGVVSYFQGERSNWHTGIPTYSELLYRNLWPGIDLVYSGDASRLEYRFVVHPGATPADIRLAYRGATWVREDAAGGLRVTTPAGDFDDTAPRSFQALAGRQAAVSSSFIRAGASFGFRVGPYDHSRTLVIDPTVLVYAGYLGGSSFDTAYGIAVDSSGSAYVFGQTGSSDFPAASSTGSYDTTFNGGTDLFLAKVSPDGTAVEWATYIGGDGEEYAFGIAVDSSGNAYITGEADADSFPVTVGSFDTSYNGADDAFVAKVKSDGTDLVYSTYLGGSKYDSGYGIAVDSSGNAYVTGEADSSDTDTIPFPVTTGPDSTYNGGVNDAFVAKVNADGSDLDYSGYIGGSANEYGYGVAVDSSDRAYVAGHTSSTEATFPETGGPDLIFNGGGDGFVAKVNAAGTALTYAGYLGGIGDESAYAIAVDSSGHAYVTGYTTSTAATFPETVGPDLSFNGGNDAFVAKVTADGTGLAYAGYLGGNGNEFGNGIAVDSSGNAYVGGSTSSPAATFPETRGPDLTYNGGTDAFAAKVNTSGTALSYAGYMGGSEFDSAFGIALDSSRNAYVAGQTLSTEATFPETGGPDLTSNGSTDAFVAEIGPAPYFPDGKIRKHGARIYRGNDVYGVNGANETVTVGATRGSTVVFDIQEQNDGAGIDSIAVKGPGNRAGFITKYLAGASGSTDITADVTAGTFAFVDLSPGAAATLRLVVHVKPGTGVGTLRSWLIVGTSTHDPARKDAVAVNVKVIRG